MPRWEVSGRKTGGRPARRFMGAVKEDIDLAGVRAEDASDGGLDGST